jgi:hypothetical protein
MARPYRATPGAYRLCSAHAIRCPILAAARGAGFSVSNPSAWPSASMAVGWRLEIRRGMGVAEYGGVVGGADAQERAPSLRQLTSTCVACVPCGGGGTRRSTNASCRRSASRVVTGPILRLTNQRSPRRTSSARRLTAAPLHSVEYRQEVHCHDCCPRSSSHVSPTSVFPNPSCSFVATSLNAARIVDAADGAPRGNNLAGAVFRMAVKGLSLS